jgi:hypothetical protein
MFHQLTDALQRSNCTMLGLGLNEAGGQYLADNPVATAPMRKLAQLENQL